LGRYGESLTGFTRPQNWARGKLIAREMDRSPFGGIGGPVLSPQVRTRVGDVEIDNPLLTYRQGDASMGADFLNTGVVSMKNGSYDNPMFAQGKLFYGSPSEVPSLLNPSSGATKGSRSGRVFLLRKPKDMTAKSDLLVSDIDMANANKDSHIVSPYIRVQDEEGNIIVTKVNEDLRRVPFAEEPATSENTTLYRWKPNYGYKRVDSPESNYVVGKEIVDDAGNLNINVDDLLEQIKAEYPYTLNPEDLINKGINGSTDLSEHIQAVVRSAQTYPLPKGVSRKEFVTAALYHDLGKVFGDFGHGTNSAIIASELNLPITRNTIKAISQHMNQQEYFETASQLEKALHAADVGRGMKYEALIEKYPYLKYDTPQITAENAARMTPEQWTAAQDAAIAKGDMAEAQRLRDLHFKVGAPNSAAVGEDGFPLSLFHGTRTAKGIRKNGFSKAMSGKGNRGADEGNIYLTNNYENAVYTGIKAHEVEPLIDKVNSVYDLFGSETIPSLNQIYSQADNLSKQLSKINEQLYKLHTGTVWDKISTSLGLKNSPSNRAKKLQSIIDSNNRNIDELNRRAHIVGFLDDGLSFIGGNRDRTVVNTLNFIKEPVNPTSPYRQIAADRTINAMYGTTDQIYSPEVLRLYGNFESPLLSDFKMSPTDINPLKADKWSQIRVDYNNREKALLQELASPQYDSSISKNKFDVLFGNVYIAKKPNSLKLADAVTYDNNGVRIPLGKRDNFKLNDIRYGLLPFGIGLGTLGTVHGTFNRRR
jgi:hypothetical protein